MSCKGGLDTLLRTAAGQAQTGLRTFGAYCKTLAGATILAHVEPSRIRAISVRQQEEKESTRAMTPQTRTKGNGEQVRTEKKRGRFRAGASVSDAVARHDALGWVACDG